MKQANLSHEVTISLMQISKPHSLIIFFPPALHYCQSLGETLCAIVLLQRITPLQAFEEFLEARKAAILGLLSNFKNSATPIMEFVCQIIGILQSTIELINLTFVAGSDGSSVLEKYLTYEFLPLERFFASDGSNSSISSETWESTSRWCPPRQNQRAPSRGCTVPRPMFTRFPASSPIPFTASHPTLILESQPKKESKSRCFRFLKFQKYFPNDRKTKYEPKSMFDRNGLRPG